MKGVVFATDYLKGKRILEDIIEGYDIYNDIHKIDDLVSSNRRVCRFENGDSWTLITELLSARGYRFNIAYIDRAFGVRNIKEYFLPCLVYKPFSATHYFGEPDPEEKEYFELLL